MNKNIMTLRNTRGMGYATVRHDSDTDLFQGVCSNGNSTKYYKALSDCIRELNRWGYR